MQFVNESNLSLDAIENDTDSWFVDYGVELSPIAGRDSLAWRADSRTALLEVVQIPTSTRSA